MNPSDPTPPPAAVDPAGSGAGPGPATPRIVPRATYRLQLHRDFGFRAATRALPYLATLGISHVYCSPYLRASAGSLHGYDGVDPTMLNPELGSAEDYAGFCRALADAGMGQLLDIVPNHMGIDSPLNRWWQDVLRFGPASAYAGRFDIDWDGNDVVPPGRLLLPVLGDAADAVIGRGELTLALGDPGAPPSAADAAPPAEVDAALPGARFRLVYFDRELPVNAAGTARILAAAARRRDGGLGASLADPALIAAVADCQHYRLAPWQQAATAINYRRFFDVTSLAALRMEDPAVFEETHRLVIDLVRNGLVDGLRIDHPDGMRDPGEYFRRLQRAVAAEAGPAGRPEADPAGRTGAAGAERPLYVVAEKILAPHESLPADWPVAGTTGYDFANAVCGVLLDGDSVDAIDRIWRDFTGERTERFAAMARATKREVLEAAFGSEWRRLALRFVALLHPEAGHGGDPDPAAVEAAATVIGEVIAGLPVYRTYPGADPSPAERHAIGLAVDAARGHLEARHQPMLDALAATLTAGTRPAGADLARHERDAVIVGFQQLAAPVMAKGVEDTALYRWGRLVSINDVGGDPDIHGISVAEFHETNRRRLAGWPHAMLATSTHDNKRGEYVRMRINVLSELPERWREIVARWHAAVERVCLGGTVPVRPARADLFLLFQTLIGTMPVASVATSATADEEEAGEGEEAGEEGVAQAAAVPAGIRDAALRPGPVWPAPVRESLQDYRERIKAYLHKAGREAKRRTSWTDPDTAYEAALATVVDRLLGDAGARRMIARDCEPFARYGAINSLAASTLKLTSPGVPDTYQGANILDDSLVDPDNRRPVDFDERLPVIRELAALAEAPGDVQQAQVGRWLSDGDFARLKLWTLHRLLRHRAADPDLHAFGDYRPLTVAGPQARHVIAFARVYRGRGLLVAVTRLPATLGGRPRDGAIDLAPLGADAAGQVDPGCDLFRSPADGPAAAQHGGSAASLAVAEVFRLLPVAVIPFRTGAADTPQ